MLKHKYTLLIATLLFVIPGLSFASCAFDTDPGNITATKSYVMPVAATISVPPETPVGKVIYRLRISLVNQGIVYVSCTNNGPFFLGYHYLTTPHLPSSYSSAVYETGVPGIGAKFVHGNSAGDFPATVASTGCPLNTGCVFASGWPAESRLILVKTASTVSPGVVQASQLPSVVYSYGQSGSMLDVYKIALSGSITITTPTCDITPASQSMTVNMGKHDIAAFSGIGTATEWKNAGIQLVNCAQFFGNIPPGYTGGTFNGTTTSHSGLNSNSLTITLSPLNGIEDAVNGIMKIDDHPLKATGIGIQLSTTESTGGIINLANAVSRKLPKDGSTAISVPLYARYIQTENTIFAGKANGRLEYTLSYQ